MPDVFTPTPAKVSEAPAKPVEVPKDGTTASNNDSSLYSSYKTDAGHPYSAKYFGIEHVHDTGDAFTEEITVIEDYMKHQIDSGKLADSTLSVGEQLKKLEKIAGIDKSEPTTMRMGKLVAYIKFLTETDKLVADHRKWA